MADPRSEQPKRSLTMQRIAINRSLAFARVFIVVGVLWMVLSLALLSTGGNLVLHLAQLVPGVLFLGAGLIQLHSAREQLRNFEEENGAGAGEQNPVR